MTGSRSGCSSQTAAVSENATNAVVSSSFPSYHAFIRARVRTLPPALPKGAVALPAAPLPPAMTAAIRRPVWRRDRAFHHTLLTLSGNRRLADYVDSLRDMVLIRGETTAGRSRLSATRVADPVRLVRYPSASSCP